MSPAELLGFRGADHAGPLVAEQAARVVAGECFRGRVERLMVELLDATHTIIAVRDLAHSDSSPELVVEAIRKLVDDYCGDVDTEAAELEPAVIR